MKKDKSLKATLVVMALTAGVMTQAMGETPVDPSTVVSRDYGPMIQVTGTAGEQDLKIHSGWNTTIKPNKDGYLIGTVVAFGKGNTVTMDAGEGNLGADDKKADEVMKIRIDATKLEGDFFKRNYKEYYYTGDFIINDPIVAKAESGGTIVLKGKDMNFNLLYALKNNHAEKGTTEELKSTIKVDLMGDLIAGDANNAWDTARPDWLRQSGIAGGSFRTGDIDTGAGDGVILVKAKNVKAFNVKTYEESEIKIEAKENVYVNSLNNTHESKMDVYGKKIDVLKGVGASSGEAVSHIGNENTETINIGGVIVLNSSSEMYLQAKDKISMLGGWDFTDNLSKTKKTKQDIFDIKTANLDVQGDMTFHGDKVTVKASKAITLSTKRWNIGTENDITIEGNTIAGKIEGMEISRHQRGDRLKAIPEKNETTVTLISKTGGDIDLGSIHSYNVSHAVKVSGFDSIHTGALRVDNLTETPDVNSKTDISLSGKNIQVGSNMEDRNQGAEYNPYSSILSDMDSKVSLTATEKLRLDGYINNVGEVAIKAKELSVYHLNGSNYDAYCYNLPSKVTVEAERIDVDTAIGVAHRGGKLTITAKDVVFKKDGAYYGPKAKNPAEGIPYNLRGDNNNAVRKDVGTIWATQDGTIDLFITEGGSVECATSIHRTLMDPEEAKAQLDALDGKIKRYEAALAKESKPDRKAHIQAYINQYKAQREPYAHNGDPGVINLHLAKDATWKADNDSSVTLIDGIGNVDLSQNKPINVLLGTLKDSPTLLVNKEGAQGILTVENLEGTPLVLVNGFDADFVKNGRFDHVKFLNAVNLNGNEAKSAPHYIDGKLYAYKAPIVKEENAFYLDGAMTKDKAFVNPVAASSIEIVSSSTNLWRYGTSEEALLGTSMVIDINHMWADVNHNSLKDGDAKGNTTQISLGKDLYEKEGYKAGLALVYRDASIKDNLETAMTHVELAAYSQKDLADMAYVKGYVSLGRASFDYKGAVKGSVHTWTQGIGLEYGKAFETEKFQYTPFARFGIHHINGYKVALDNGFQASVDGETVPTASVGVKFDYKATDKLGLFGQVALGHSFGHNPKGSIGDGEDIASYTFPIQKSFWNMALGVQYKVANGTQLQLYVNKNNGADLIGAWGLGAKLNYKF